MVENVQIQNWSFCLFECYHGCQDLLMLDTSRLKLYSEITDIHDSISSSGVSCVQFLLNSPIQHCSMPERVQLKSTCLVIRTPELKLYTKISLYRSGYSASAAWDLSLSYNVKKIPWEFQNFGLILDFGAQTFILLRHQLKIVSCQFSLKMYTE